MGLCQLSIEGPELGLGGQGSRRDDRIGSLEPGLYSHLCRPMANLGIEIYDDPSYLF